MIPKPIYDALPSLYLAAGSASVVSLEAEIGKLSGLVLIMAGSIVLYWRGNFRSLGRTGARLE